MCNHGQGKMENLKNINRDILCYRCHAVVGVQKFHNSTPKVGRKLCQVCKQLAEKKRIEEASIRLKKYNKTNLARRRASNRMLNNNPAKRIDIKEKISNTLKRKYATGELISAFQDPKKLKEIRSKLVLTDAGRLRLSEKMRKNNPAKQQKVRDKITKTIRRKIQAGELIYKSGNEHWLWKGNRSFSTHCRLKLKEWKINVLIRDNRRCTMCGYAGKYLQVHHIKPLREFINEMKIRHNIQDLSNESINNWDLYANEIISQHSIEDGITLCRKCHSKIDSKFKNLKY